VIKQALQDCEDCWLGRWGVRMEYEAERICPGGLLLYVEGDGIQRGFHHLQKPRSYLRISVQCEIVVDRHLRSQVKVQDGTQILIFFGYIAS